MPPKCSSICWIRSSRSLFARDELDALRDQLAVIRIGVRFRPVAELQVNDLRISFGARPTERLATFFVVRGDQGRDVFSSPETPINFIANLEIADSGGHGMIFRDDLDRVFNVVLVADLVRNDAAFPVTLW